MSLPQLSHLQFLVLAFIHPGEQTGREIREALRDFRVRQSGPAFYQMMARLEAAGLVEGWYTKEVVEGQTIKERRYRITGPGAEAWRESRAFYAQAFGGTGEEGLAHA